MLSFVESGLFIYVLAALALIGMIAKFASAARYGKLERQTRDVALTRDPYIRLWKNKFENAYRVNKGMNDPDLFVERCMNQCKMMGIPLIRWDRLNRILCSLCLMAGIAAAALEVSAGIASSAVLGHFLASLCICGVMLFVEYICETGEKRQRAGLNLEEYFVNTLSHRLQMGTEMTTAEAGQAAGSNQGDILKEAAPEKKEPLRREKDKDSLRDSLDRIAASREPADDDRREKRSRIRREEDIRLIEDILREYLRE